MNRIQKLFSGNTEKVIPYIPAGFPELDSTKELVLAAVEAGADMVEIGMPFSDPLADGPVIQASSQIAIENGVNISWILDTVSNIRQRSEIPIALMGYINPVIHYGLHEFISDASDSGVDGLIIPDLPLEEAGNFVDQSKGNGIVPILLVAPNTPENRINEISKLAEELIYCVAILGITGSSGANDEELKSYLNRVNKYSDCPYIVGFGISERSDVIKVNKISHGAVVGSAIIKEMEKYSNPVECVKHYIERLTL